MGGLAQCIKERIDSLSYLPTTMAVAMKFIELGKNLESDPDDYVKVISSDGALSAKLLALANSSWYGVRNKVTKIKVAVNLLGLGSVRTLAMSYCVAGLHNELRLKPDEARTLWEGALCKAVAARHFAGAINRKLEDDAFMAGLFQDFALTVMYSIAADKLRSVLEDALVDWRGQLERESATFGIDHVEAGRMLAQKLELPDFFVDAVAFHHDYRRLTEYLQNPPMADALYAASLFPHILRAWNQADAAELATFLREHARGENADIQSFLANVQRQFEEVYRFFEDGRSPEARLDDLLAQATREMADNTTDLVASVNQLMHRAVSMGSEISELQEQRSRLADLATRDQLTGVLNREGFQGRAKALLANAARYGVGLAIVYLDIDKFKSVNDTAGHKFGDLALKHVAEQMMGACKPQDLAGRIGGDELVMALYDYTATEAAAAVRRVVEGVAGQPLHVTEPRPAGTTGRTETTGTAPRTSAGDAPARRGNAATGQADAGDGQRTITISAGLLWIPPSRTTSAFETLLTEADHIMYEAKRAGGNRVHVRTWKPDPPGGPSAHKPRDT